MFRGRAVGTLTLGISFILFGAFFLVNSFGAIIPYQILFTLWPIVFILLGTEVLISHAVNKESKPLFSGVSIFLLVLLTLFALAVGSVGFFLSNYEELYAILRAF